MVLMSETIITVKIVETLAGTTIGKQHVQTQWEAATETGTRLSSQISKWGLTKAVHAMHHMGIDSKTPIDS